MKRTILLILATLFMTVAKAQTYYYLDENAEEQSVTDVVLLTDSSETTLTSGFYYVARRTTIEDRLTIKGDVVLILYGDLTCSSGITVQEGNSLTITTTPKSTYSDLVATAASKYDAAIGGEYAATAAKQLAAGTINIWSGEVIATGSSASLSSETSYCCAAGIGGCYKGGAGTINITGGTIKSTSPYDTDSKNAARGADIGSGYKGEGGVINISGGEVTTKINANGTGNGAGIGGGQEGSVDTIRISGGEEIRGYYLGRGKDSRFKAMILSGGKINVTYIGGDGVDSSSFIDMCGADITCEGISGNVRKIKVSAGSLTIDDNYGNGIKGGENTEIIEICGGNISIDIAGIGIGDADTILISNGTLDVAGCVGIGGYGRNISLVDISGGTITASGKGFSYIARADTTFNSVGIGGEYPGGVNKIQIRGGEVNAYGGRGNGIGGRVDTIHISGGTIHAYSVQPDEDKIGYGAAIGGIYRKKAGSIIISGGTVYAYCTKSISKCKAAAIGAGGDYKGTDRGTLQIIGNTAYVECYGDSAIDVSMATVTPENYGAYIHLWRE